MKVSTGDTVNPTIGGTSWVERIVQSIPASYTIWYNSTDGKYYAESNIKGGTDYSGTTATTIIQNAIDATFANGGGRIFLRNGIYQLTNIGAKLIDLDDMGGIILHGEGTPWAIDAPTGNNALPAGSVNGTLLMAPANYDGIVISHEMTAGQTNGLIGLKDIGICGNTSHANIAAGNGCTGVSFANVRTVDSKVEDVSVSACKRGFYIGGSSIAMNKCFSEFCYNGYYIPHSAEYVTLSTCHSYMDYEDGFYVASSGVNTLLDCLTMPSSTDIHSSGAGTWIHVAPVGYMLESHQALIVIGCTHYGCGTGFYIWGGGDYECSVLLDGITAFSFDLTPDIATYPAAVQIYMAEKHRVNVTNAQLLYYARGIYVVKSSTTSYLDISGCSLNTNTTPVDLNFLEGIQDGKITIRHNIDYSTENSGTSTGTGAQQTIAHGCSFTPSYDEVFLSERNTGGALAYQSAAPDATNIYVTATAAKTYNWKVERA